MRVLTILTVHNFRHSRITLGSVPSHLGAQSILSIFWQVVHTDIQYMILFLMSMVLFLLLHSTAVDITHYHCPISILFTTLDTYFTIIITVYLLLVIQLVSVQSEVVSGRECRTCCKYTGIWGNDKERNTIFNCCLLHSQYNS